MNKKQLRGGACWLNLGRFIMSSEQEVRLNQKAKTKWLEACDLNTKIFSHYIEAEDNEKYN